MIELYSKDDVKFLQKEFDTLRSNINDFFNNKMKNIDVYSLVLTHMHTDIKLHIGTGIYYCVIKNNNIDFHYYSSVGALTIYDIEEAHSIMNELYQVFLTPENKKTLLEYNSVFKLMDANYKSYCENIREYFIQHTIRTNSDENERSLKLAYAMLI